VLTDSDLKSKVDALWNKMRDGGLPNPLDSIEQLSFLLFMKRLDEEETRRERQANLRGIPYQSLFMDKEGTPKPEYRWSQWTQRTGNDALQFVKGEVFPFIKGIGGATSGFAQHMANAEFKINKPTLLQDACASIDALKVSQQNQDVQGDVYEYMLGKLGDAAGRNGQFRTPRHIIRMMVQMIDPRRASASATRPPGRPASSSTPTSTSSNGTPIPRAWTMTRKASRTTSRASGWTPRSATSSKRRP